MITAIKIISIINIVIGGLAVLFCTYAAEPMITFTTGGMWLANGIMIQVLFSKYTVAKK